ncbi:GTPase domain-containing protein [Roseobacter sp. S98]|uniref:GTPase domain-containing protein n=1 Tax=Roseobacter algicola (ex Choi et al. 2025) (nom. illeg.) TaxID=3092138 RepID=UPI0035C7015B
MTDHIPAALRAVTENTALPRNLRAAAASLIDCLDRPVRITLVGRRHTGKTCLANMLAGHHVLPATDGLTMTEAVWSAQAKTLCEYSTGQIVTLDTEGTEFTLPEQAMRLRLELTDACLKDRSLTEVTLPDDTGMARDLLDMVADHTDILLWCAADVEDQSALWNCVPDQLSGRSLFVVTMADRLHAAGTLSGTLSRAQNMAGSGFTGIYPLVAHRAEAAAADTDDKEILRKSGGHAILTRVTKIIQQARQSDLLRAQAILDQCALATETKTCREMARATSGLDKWIDKLTTARPDQTVSEILSLCQKAMSGLVVALPDEATTFRAEVSDAIEHVEKFARQNSDSAARNAVALLVQLNRELSVQKSA